MALSWHQWPGQCNNIVLVLVLLLGTLMIISSRLGLEKYDIIINHVFDLLFRSVKLHRAIQHDWHFS